MKSPFIIVQDFISPLMCERIIEDIKVEIPNTNSNGDPVKLERHCEKWESALFEEFKPLIQRVESTYSAEYKGLQHPLFQHFPENAKTPAEPPGCENSKFVRKKWVMYRDVDLVGFIWLNEFNSNVPLDPRFEVYGGKLEFPAYNFSLQPQRGTLVIFPASPHFITAISPILVGNLYQIKLNINIKAKGGVQWLYNPSLFPGRWEQWFEEFL